MFIEHGLIKYGNKIFAVHSDKNNFMFTITETAENGKRVQRKYKKWAEVPRADREEYQAACAVREANGIKYTFYEKIKQNIKK